ncbi:hypothetical protein [uncultured Ilyobacter sp.]|uniref:hypothetical protein n=1 Tax=uncultured Ilyobacter sp. TaxID=544433 RepID=UPI0029C8EBDE|nr:hypothetical protein [uncultured Ilyobacter sp.]
MEKRIKVAIFGAISIILALLGHEYKERRVELEKKPWGYTGRAKDSKGNQGILEVYIKNGQIVNAKYDEVCYPESEKFAGQMKKENTAYNLKMQEKSGISFDEAVSILETKYKTGEKIDFVAGATGTTKMFKKIARRIDREIK